MTSQPKLSRQHSTFEFTSGQYRLRGLLLSKCKWECCSRQCFPRSKHFFAPLQIRLFIFDLLFLGDHQPTLIKRQSLYLVCVYFQRDVFRPDAPNRFNRAKRIGQNCARSEQTATQAAIQGSATNIHPFHRGNRSPANPFFMRLFCIFWPCGWHTTSHKGFHSRPPFSLPRYKGRLNYRD